jgi:hypothetical protein
MAAKSFSGTQRAAAAVCLGITALGLLNWGFWQLSILGLSQKQMLILAFLPAFIFAMMLTVAEEAK